MWYDMVAPSPGCGELSSTPPSTEECGADCPMTVLARGLGRKKENRSDNSDRSGNSEISQTEPTDGLLIFGQSDSAPSVVKRERTQKEDKEDKKEKRITRKLQKRRIGKKEPKVRLLTAATSGCTPRYSSTHQSIRAQKERGPKGIVVCNYKTPIKPT